MEGTERTEEAEEAEASNKRKRRSDVEDVNSNMNIVDEEEQPHRKKRRRSITKAWDSLSDTVASWVAKGFLLAVEWAAQNVPNGELADEKDLIESVLNMLDYFQGSDLDILRRGWRVLCVCSDSSVPVWSAILEVDVCESDVFTVVAAMRLHPECIRIQLLGCRALRTLVMKSEEAWKSLCHSGAISVFIQAMQTFPDDIVMQGLAITFVAMLVREIGESPRRKVLELQGIQVILDTMRRFGDDPRLLHTACYALHQIGFIPLPRAIILSNGGIDLLLQSLDRHMDDVALVDLCLSALSKLSDEDNLVGREVIPLILKSMKRWPDEQSIQGHNLVLMLRAVGGEPIPHKDSIRLVLAAMMKFQESASLQFFGCAALREILERTHGREALDAISSEGGIERILTAVQKHNGIFGLQPMALLVLMHIWEQRRPEQQAVATAFGGSDHAIVLITGLRMERIPEEDQV